MSPLEAGCTEKTGKLGTLEEVSIVFYFLYLNSAGKSTNIHAQFGANFPAETSRIALESFCSNSAVCEHTLKSPVINAVTSPARKDGETHS